MKGWAHRDVEDRGSILNTIKGKKIQWEIVFQICSILAISHHFIRNIKIAMIRYKIRTSSYTRIYVTETVGTLVYTSSRLYVRI